MDFGLLVPTHFKWVNPCRIRHQIENIKSLDEEKTSDEPKWNRIEAEFENSPCILNGKTLAELGTEFKI